MYEGADEQGVRVRERAISALVEIDAGRAGSQTALQPALDGQGGGPALQGADRRLCTELVYGVLRRQRPLDRWIAPASTRGLVDLSPGVLAALRVGAYQLTELQRIPSYAAVNATVQACKTPGLCPQGAVGFVHAVLRKLAAQADAGRGPDGDDFPPWIVQRLDDLSADLGLEPLAARAAWTGEAPLHVHVMHAGELESLREDGLELQPLPIPATALASSAALHHPRFGRTFVAQDAASAAITEWLDAQSGDLVLDVAAGRGVKSAFLSARGARVTALDLSGEKLAQAESLARALGAPLERTVVADATQPLPVAGALFDVVLVDAPCSGLGTLRRRPEIRHRRRAADLVGLAQMQAKIAHHAAQVVRPGGVLMLATCSVTREEGPLWCAEFLAQHPAFALEPGQAAWMAPLLTGPGWLRTHPGLHGMDGFFAARLVRQV